MKTILKIMGSALGTTALLAFIAPTTQAQNLLTDPGFELQTTAPNPNPTGVPGWANFNGASFLQTPLAHSGSYVLDTPNSGGGYSVPGTYQVFAATPGETFTFSSWVYTPNQLVANANDFAILQLSFFAGSPPDNYGGTGVGSPVGVNVGDPAGGGGVALPQGVWTFATVSATAPAGANSLGAYLLNINADSNADFYFDDASLTATPEPSTLALIGVGLLGVWRRRSS